MADKVQKQPNSFDLMEKRERQLVNEGLDWGRARGRASLEFRIREWPSGWGDDLQIVIYGDFEPPKSDLHIQPLGITIHPGKLENTVISSGRCVLKATVKIKEKSVPALKDAMGRINVLLGAWTLVTWGIALAGGGHG